MTRTEAENNLYNPILKENTKGFIDNSIKEQLQNNFTYGYVLRGMEYRPDLVAYYYFGDPRKAWMITVANNFRNGIKDYTSGRKLKIPGEV